MRNLLTPREEIREDSVVDDERLLRWSIGETLAAWLSG